MHRVWTTIACIIFKLLLRYRIASLTMPAALLRIVTRNIRMAACIVKRSWAPLVIRILHSVVFAESCCALEHIYIQDKCESSRYAEGVLAFIPTFHQGVVAYNPSIPKANSALYIWHTMIPVSPCHISMLHWLNNVLLAHQDNMPKPAAHRAKSRELTKRLRRGLRPMQQCMIIVVLRARMVKRDAVVNFN